MRCASSRVRSRPVCTCCALAAVLACAATAAFAANSAPVITALPALNSSTLVADDATPYTVNFTVRDANGYDDISSMRVLFNYTYSGGDQARGRGYLAWGLNDAAITRFGGTWTLTDAPAGGRWGYRTDQWGGTTYITPVSCSTTTSGKATGGTGSRTVVWTFTAKPAWAWNPVTNTADGWTEDVAQSMSGWRPNTAEFDVVAAPCQNVVPTPRAPVLSSPTVGTLDVAIDPGDSADDLFAIRVSPALDNKVWVQVDGSLGVAPVYQTRAAWGVKTVTGLASSTAYALKVRAARTDHGWCPSPYGLESIAATSVQSHNINTAAPGKWIRRGVIGNATRLDTFPNGLRLWDKLWAVLDNTCARGIAGGLDADTYNWKDMSAQGAGHTGTPGPDVPTTLTWMRLARDHNAMPLLTINPRGVGPVEASGYCRFYYADTSLETVKKLAADWVRYINHILPNHREGDTLSSSDQAILDSVNWYGRPKLLAPGEPSTPKVTYWEIGNEPEVGLPWCTPGAATVALSPAEYAARYREIAAAMRAVDPSIKVGPCITTANNGNAWLEAVLDDRACQVDFISYHPYGPLYWNANSMGDTPDAAESGLRYMKSQQQAYYNGIVSLINGSGRSLSTIKLIASEYNPSDWHWECGAKAARMSHALGLAETIFQFIDQEHFAANYWSGPAYCSDGTETPGYKLFEKFQETFGDYDLLLDSYDDGINTRVYTTWNTAKQDLSVWVLNFSETHDMPVQLSLQNLGQAGKITMSRLAMLTGPTSLLDINSTPYSSPPAIDWVDTDLTGTLDPSDFTMTFPHATITVLRLHRPLRTLPDSTPVTLGGMSVTATYPSEAYLYVENDDRSFGIRVSGGFPGLTIGDRVNVTGNMSVRKSSNLPIERQVSVATVTRIASAAPMQPIGMNCRSVGGGPIGTAPGVKDGSGANNVGLLVTIAGRVTLVSGQIIFVDDGTSIADSSGRATVAVKCSAIPTVKVGDIVRVTGVVEGNLPYGWTENRRYMRARTSADVVKVQ